ncbi:glycosyltransferase [Paenibacillus bouchesdurhonensis]|uniref:glycosyltransferase n=1 Tax=Paenibacillus bouchesdurhonensis TaxID=1870990 RepID=UPI000DA60A50|nr:glycosyltransferase [Paenibacillus bouchesdurhonensis]
MKRRKNIGSKRKHPVKVPFNRPIVKYVVNAQAPKRIVLLNNEEKNHAIGESRIRNHDSELRIMMVLDQFNVGGTETHILTSVRELLRRRIHVVVVGKKGEMMDAFAALGCPIYELNFVTEDYLQNTKEEKKIVAQMKQILNVERINVIHAHQIPSSHFAMAASEQLRIPLIFTVHGHYSINEALVMRKSKSLLCVSPSILKKLPVHGVATHLIPNGIDMVQFNDRPYAKTELRNELGIPETAPLIMYAGRLSWEKADICRDMIEACYELRKERYPDLHLLIIGEGRQSELISDLTNVVHEQVGQNFIHLLGNSLNMSRYYTTCNLVVGTGRTAVEALACRCPVVAIGVKGFIGPVNPNNYEAAWDSWFGDHHANEKWSSANIKESLQQVLEMSDYEREEQGWVGRNFVKEQFDIIDTTNILLNVYNDLLRNQRMVYEVK